MIVVMTPGWEQKIEIEGTPKIHRVVDEVEKACRRNLAHHVRSGDMLSSLYSTKTVNGGRVYVGTDHWQFIEYPTKPHIINPRIKQALWWVGAPHPMRRVRHPGTREYAPMRRALASVRW